MINPFEFSRTIRDQRIESRLKRISEHKPSKKKSKEIDMNFRPCTCHFSIKSDKDRIDHWYRSHNPSCPVHIHEPIANGSPTGSNASAFSFGT